MTKGQYVHAANAITTAAYYNYYDYFYGESIKVNISGDVKGSWTKSKHNVCMQVIKRVFSGMA